MHRTWYWASSLCLGLMLSTALYATVGGRPAPTPERLPEFEVCVECPAPKRLSTPSTPREVLRSLDYEPHKVSVTNPKDTSKRDRCKRGSCKQEEERSCYYPCSFPKENGGWPCCYPEGKGYYPACEPRGNGCWQPCYPEDNGGWPACYPVPCRCRTSACCGPNLDRFCATAVAGCGDDIRWPNELCGNDPFRDDRLYCGVSCCDGDDDGCDCCSSYEDSCYAESWLGPAYLCPDYDLCWDSYEWCGFNCANGYNVAGTLNPDYRRHGIFMPSAPTLFPQFIADPRAINLSVGWRFNDQVFEKNMINVSYAQWCPFWRWFDVFCCGDAMQFEIEGCLWAIFDPLHDSSPLVNADYYVGFPLTWKCGRWSWKLRGYHISSHIGDEFLLDHPRFVRRNPSAQYIDLFVAYELMQETRIFFGYGRIFGADESFPMKANYFGWGAECYLPYLRWNGWRHCVEGRPFLALFMRNLQEDGYQQDLTFALGYEFHKLTGLEGKLRAFLEWHQGHSLEGQFSRLKTDYFSIRLSYGY